MKGVQYHITYSFSLSLLAFTMIALPKLLLIPIAIFVFVLVIGGIKKHLIFEFNKILLLFLLLYLAYVIGTFFTENREIALKYLEFKLSLLLFPVLFSFKLKEKFSIATVGLGLILGTTLLSFLGIGNSLICYNGVQEINCFFSSNFSGIHHPSYSAPFYLIAMCVSFYGWKQKWKLYKAAWVFPFLILTILSIVLCMSLAGLLFFFLFFGAIILYSIYTRYNKKFFIVTIIGLPIIFYVLLMTIPVVKEQFNTSVNYLKEYIENPTEFIKNKQTYVGGNETRLIMWTAAFMEFKDHPFGVGTGNVDDHLGERLKTLGQAEMAKKNYNPHNQYLQTGLEVGWIGLLILLGIIFFGVQLAFRDKNWLLLLLISNLTFNMFFESMLQRQSGIVFFTFWICLLVVYKISKSNNSQQIG